MKTRFFSLLVVLLGGYACAQDAPLPPVSLVSVDPLPEIPQKPDRFFLDLKGGYAISRDDDMPGMPGFVLEAGIRGRTWNIVHEGFLSFGYYAGDESYTFEEARDRFGVEAWYDDRYRSDVKHKVSSMPLSVGYRMAVPLGRSGISLYAGARYGLSYFSDEFVQPAWCDGWYSDDPWDDDHNCENRDRTLARKSFTKGSCSFGGGFKVALSSSVELALGYEYYRIGSMKPWHIVQAGVTWTF